jgi:sugar lactone lactonase YvrE
MAYPSRAWSRATHSSYVLLAAWLALSGCGNDMSRSGGGSKPPTGGDSTGSEPDMSSGRKVLDAPPMHVAANDMRSRAPMDATPSADGERVFYTALGLTEDDASTPGVFSVDAKGGKIEALALGGAITAPVGISISPDSKLLFVADSAWRADDDRSAGTGAIVTLESNGGMPAALPGTQGYVPRGLVVAEVAKKPWLYFSGVDPKSGAAGVFRTPLSGGAVERIASGEPFVDPAGLAVTKDGDVYVLDALASHDGNGQASLVRVRNGKAERLMEGLGAGFPAGVATTADDKTVLVSGLDPRSRRDRVFLIDTTTAELSEIQKPFSDFSAPAGLHRAHDKNTFAWADSEANGSGTVYVLEL